MTLDESELHYQVAVARETVRRRYGVPVNWFCYPSGHYDARVIAEVKAAGYEGSTTVVPGLGAAGRRPLPPAAAARARRHEPTGTALGDRRDPRRPSRAGVLHRRLSAAFWLSRASVGYRTGAGGRAVVGRVEGRCQTTAEDAQMADDALTIRAYEESDRYVLVLSGELDMSGVAAFEAAAVTAVRARGRRSPRRHHQDRLHRLERAAARSWLVKSACEERGCRFSMSHGSGQAEKLFEVTRLIERLPFRKSGDHAPAARDRSLGGDAPGGEDGAEARACDAARWGLGAPAAEGREALARRDLHPLDPGRLEHLDERAARRRLGVPLAGAGSRTVARWRRLPSSRKVVPITSPPGLQAAGDLPHRRGRGPRACAGR